MLSFTYYFPKPYKTSLKIYICIYVYIFISFLLNILSFLLRLWQLNKYNFLIYLLFSKNDISEIFVLLIFKISNFSNLEIGVKSLIFSQ